MTVELFREDAYLKACEAQVTAVHEHGIVLDRTVFYPTGGGQPGDIGVLEPLDGGEPVSIIDTRKGEKPNEILHIAEQPPAELDGAKVRAGRSSIGTGATG